MSERLEVIDIHTHLWPPAWAPGGPRAKSHFNFRKETLERITNPQILIDEFRQAGIELGVVTATIESLYGHEGPVDFAGVREANDWLAKLQQDHEGIVAFAVTDAFAGDAGAREAERAITELGLAGLVLDSARDGHFIGDSAVRPILEVAARHRVPVFVHPVSHPQADVLIRGAGTLGNSAGRGLINSVAFLSVIQSSLLDELPDLHLIFATLGLGGIVQASRGGRYSRAQRQAKVRPNIYFDTMGDDPAIIRTLVDFFGAERVLAGTDWPILPALRHDSLQASLTEAGLNGAEQRLIAGGNARRLLGLRLQDAVAAAE
ncbi:amidohydrolase family protein [Rhizobium panacihumi]|uniref:amidohydrolase family protein n=1 Tax=Rhizobium panacihumi TaxID=2008450 RepID=UPI003D7AABD5